MVCNIFLEKMPVTNLIFRLNLSRIFMFYRDTIVIDAIVFDFDGVIIDTERVCFDAWQAVFSEYNQVLPLEEWVKNIGRAIKVADPHKMLEHLTGKSINQEQLLLHARKIEMAAANKLEPLPGVVKTLKTARDMNIACAVASSSGRKWVAGHLDRMGLEHYFKTLVCREDTSTHKPEPEPYLTAVGRLGALPEKSVAIEDAPMGILSATTAGLRCVAVGCSLTKHLDLSRATWRINSLDEFDVLAV
jgi:HAD superfamily hydrolase (TIGR01509 family)